MLKTLSEKEKPSWKDHINKFDKRLQLYTTCSLDMLHFIFYMEGNLGLPIDLVLLTDALTWFLKGVSSELVRQNERSLRYRLQKPQEEKGC